MDHNFKYGVIEGLIEKEEVTFDFKSQSKKPKRMKPKDEFFLQEDGERIVLIRVGM